MNTDLALTTEIDSANPVIGDLRLDGTDFGLVVDSAASADASAQEIDVVLKWWRGEWFLDTRKGTPYIEQIFVKGVSLATIREIFRAQIKTVPSVASVPDLSVSIDRRTRLGSVTHRTLLSSGQSIPSTTVPLGEVR